MNYDAYQDQVVQRAGESVLATNKVLRNTYLLLSMTLAFSAVMTFVGTQLQLTGIHGIICWAVGFGLLFLTRYLRNSPLGLVSVFGFVGAMGLSIAPTISAYLAIYANATELIMTSLALTSGIFISLSAIAIVTKKDFGFLGKFLFIGLIVGIIAAVANIFFQIPALSLAISGMFVFIFSAYILYDTSRIINGGETNYIMATISLYLDILNLFLSLLHLLMALAGDD
ncbi:MAG: Bax inhibitor-1/YccA family protein [Gammaproteobacteria bacterium]|nr:MAG: Bax inhibitor-1/YccA family protein [Gammaproteobacteria bacterium]